MGNEVELLLSLVFLLTVLLLRRQLFRLKWNLQIFKGKTCDLADKSFRRSFKVVERGAVKYLFGVVDQNVESKFVL